MSSEVRSNCPCPECRRRFSSCKQARSKPLRSRANGARLLSRASRPWRRPRDSRISTSPTGSVCSGVPAPRKPCSTSWPRSASLRCRTRRYATPSRRRPPRLLATRPSSFANSSAQNPPNMQKSSSSPVSGSNEVDRCCTDDATGRTDDRSHSDAPRRATGARTQIPVAPLRDRRGDLKRRLDSRHAASDGSGTLAGASLQPGTIQKAYGELVKTGLVVRARGRGSFVASLQRRMAEPWHCRFVGDDGTILPIYPRLLGHETAAKDARWQALFGQNAKVVRIDRTISVNNEFEVHNRFFALNSIAKALLQRSREKVETANFRVVMTQEFGITIFRIVQTIRMADKKLWQRLGISTRPHLLLEATAYTTEGDAAYFQEIYIPPNRRKLLFESELRYS